MPLPLFQEIRIENTNSCGYKCVMCPRERQTRSIGFMSLDDFSLLTDRIGTFEGSFHLHGFGEPLLDRQLIAKIETLQKKYTSSPSLIFSTLGVRVAEDYFLKLLGAGLNTMVISLYGFTQDGYKQIHGYDGLHRVKHNLELLSRAMKLFPHSFTPVIKIPGLAVSSVLPIEQSPERKIFCEWVQDLGFEVGEWAYVHNYSDGRQYNVSKQERICPVVDGQRRNILNITWDLNVIPCCFDFNATIRFGNLRKQTLEEIFSSPEYLAFLIAQKSNELSQYSVCQNCEKNDYS